MKNFIFLTILTLLLGGCFSKKHKSITITQPETTKITKNINIKQKALIVGVNDYKDSAYDLVGTEKDVANVHKLFSSWGFDVEELYGANSLKFQDKLLELSSTLSNDDVLIIYVSGHGSYTKDYNGDEVDDNRDEILVFSDGIDNVYMIDDTLDKILDKIKARKLIIIDSCYSGTVNRSYTKSDKMVKYIPAPRDIGDFLDDGIAPTPSFLIPQIPGSTLLLSSCQDNEKSIATKNGSLFTNELVKNLDLNKNFDKVHQETLNNLSKHFHPVLSSSNPVLKNLTIKEYLKINAN